MNATTEQLEQILADAWSDEVRLQTLLQLSEHLIKTDVARSLEYATQAYELSIRFNDPSLKAEAAFRLGAAYLGFGAHPEYFQKALFFLHEAEQYYTAVNDRIRSLEVIVQKGRAYHTNYHHQTARDIFSDALMKAEEVNSDRLRRDVLNDLGLCSVYLHDYDAALDCFNECLALYRKTSERTGEAQVLSNIGMVKRHRGENLDALQFLSESLELFSELGQENRLPSLHNEIAVTLEESENYLPAFEAYREALQGYEDLGNREGCAMVLNNIGVVHKDLGQYDDALEYFTDSLKIKEEIGVEYLLHSTLRNIATVHLARQEFKEAHSTLTRCSSIPLGQNGELADALLKTVWGEFYNSTNEYDRALKEYHESAELLNEIGNTGYHIACLVECGKLSLKLGYAAKGIQVLTNALAKAEEIKRKDLKIQAHKELGDAFAEQGDEGNALRHREIFHRLSEEHSHQKQEEKLRQVMMIHDLERTRKAKKIAEQNAQILRLEKERLTREAEHRQSELTTTAMFLTQKNDLLQRITKELRNVSEQLDDRQGDILGKVIAEINETIDIDTSWKIFEEQFQKTYGDYVEKLTLRCPTLTPTELRVCLLAKTGLSIKETARILNIEPRSIEKYRQRIRKKLGLQRADNLTLYLTTID